MKVLASRLRSARRSAGYTQSELARRLQVSRSAVAQWESEAGSDPSAGNLGRLAQTLDCSFEWLATGRGTRQIAERKTTSASEDEQVLRHFARTDDEERVLELFREVDGWGKHLVLDLMPTPATHLSHPRSRQRAPKPQPAYID